MTKKYTKWADVKRLRYSDEEIAERNRAADVAVLEMNLREIRELAGKTQVEVAEAAEMSQGDVSRMERREDHLLSTLRRYVEALGGEVEVIARIGDRSVRLRGV